jgi:hypothetical protein
MALRLIQLEIRLIRNPELLEDPLEDIDASQIPPEVKVS